MDITQARETLGTINTNLQKQIDANNLADSIIAGTFQAEFTSIETNRKITEEKVALVEGLTQRAVTAESSLESEKRARVQDVAQLTSEKENLITESLAKDAQIETLTQEKTGVQGQLDGIVPPVVELLSSVTEEERANHPVLDVIQEQIDVIQPPEL